jgi:hypothetical protein
MYITRMSDPLTVRDMRMRPEHGEASAAAVRNLVTHRASAGATTLGAFGKSYYAAFDELVTLA